MVIKGEAEVTQRHPDGVEEVVNRVGPGEYFGEIGLLADAPRNATVRARTSVEAMAIDRATFRRLLESSQTTADEVRQVAKERKARSLRERAG